MTPRSAQPASVLVYSGGELVGDGLMKIPFLRALRNAFPEARITWLSGKSTTAFAGALADLTPGLIDEVIENAGVGRRVTELFARPLADRSFDLVIDTQRRIPTTLLVRRVRHGSFVSGAAGFRLSDRKPPSPYRKPPGMVRQMLDLVEAACGRPAEPGGTLRLSPLLRGRARTLLPDGPPYVGIAPGAGGAHKRWPLANFVALARDQAGRGRVPVFVLGPEEESLYALLRDAVPEARFPLQEERGRGGSPTVPLTIALAERLAAAVANDSGTGHMFAAADRPLVTLFGPTSPAKFAPLVSRGRVVSAQDFGGDTMDAIPVATVVAALDSLFRG